MNVSQTFLAHAVLAHLSPEVDALDRITALRSHGALRTADSGAKTTIASIPPEIFLHVRSYLLPTVTDDLLAETRTAYADYLLTRARSLCSECLAYNVYVYGPDSLTWPESRATDDGAQGCQCGVQAVRNDLYVGALTTGPDPHERARRGHKRSVSYSHKSVTWLEEYLSRRAGRGVPIRKVVDQVLASDFGIALTQHDAKFPTTPSSSKADVPDTVTLESPEDFRLAGALRELALQGASPTAGSEILTAARDVATKFISATIAGLPQPHEDSGAHAAPPRQAGPSIGTLVGAGLALGVYALVRLTAVL
ncbi:unnamed protein product [Peniophora sp. CBMAI 1063]|nr:unnamed protein product [Peniophora sp. CBMAI 1063]